MMLSRRVWTEQFLHFWQQAAMWAIGVGNSSHSGWGCPDYSVDNQWVSVYKDARFPIVTSACYFGSPYRKEVSEDDNLGTYQKQMFLIDNGVVVHVEDYYGTGRFGSERFPLEVGLDLYGVYESPEDAVKAFSHETGCQY